MLPLGQCLDIPAQSACRFPRCCADHALFHAPYNKLVQKAFARLMYHDMCK